MLRGVNKQIIEINSTDNTYFERAVLFVRPECADISSDKLQADAEKYIDSLSFTSVEQQLPKKREKRNCKAFAVIAAAALLSAVIALIVTVI